MSLRVRLVLALMALALLPTVVFTAFTLDQLGRSTSRWFRPGVDRALDSGVEVAKSALTRMETTVLAMADECAQRVGDRAATTAPDARARDVATTLLKGSGVDFVQYYHREATGWRRLDQIMLPGMLLPDAYDFSDAIDGAILSTRIIRSGKGALAAVTPLGPDNAIVAAIWVPPTFFADMDSVGEALGYYRQLGVVVDVQRRFVWILVVLLCAALIGLAFVLASGLARQMSRPLDDLANALSGVAGGDLEIRVRPTGAREIRTLGESFNTMTARLAEAREQLKVAEREAAWREVARRLAHEFKNILTPMSLSLYRLGRRADAVAPAERAAFDESLEALDTGVNQITRLADQFSRYARLPDPTFESIDLTAVARAACRMHEHENVRVVATDGPRLTVQGDSLLVSRAIHNLVLNACEASPAGADVVVATREANGQAWVEVLDRGPGIPPDLGGRVFDPYVSTKNRGSGLGLSLVRDVAAQHGGDAGIENREDGGARAWLALPLAAPDARGKDSEEPMS